MLVNPLPPPAIAELIGLEPEAGDTVPRVDPVATYHR